MQVSIQVPVVKGAHLAACIQSVLAQTNDQWQLSLLWDGGDTASREILESVARRADPRIRVFFGQPRGIAGARRFLAENSAGDLLLPLDDDDLLSRDAVATFLDAARAWPCAGIVRARRAFIDERGSPVREPDWFPFAPRAYTRGMTCDLFNQAQPYIVRRSAYLDAGGWHGFSDYSGAGEDCDMFARVEESSDIFLVDRTLYYYRQHPGRASLTLGSSAAFDMWRRIADQTLQRRELPLRRTNQEPPFTFGDRPAAHDAPPHRVTWIDNSTGSRATPRYTTGTIHAALDREAAPFFALGNGVRQPRPDAVDAMARDLLRANDDLVLAVVAPAETAGNPSLLVVARRYVLRAAGPACHAYESAAAQLIDLAMRARERRLHCRAAPTGPALNAAFATMTGADRRTIARRWGLAPGTTAGQESLRPE